MLSIISNISKKAVSSKTVWWGRSATARLAILATLSLCLVACQNSDSGDRGNRGKDNIGPSGEPKIIESLKEKGIVVVDTFTSKGGLKGWIGFVGDEPIVFYLTPDGKYVITGSVLDSNLQDVNQGAIESKLVTRGVSNVWEKVEASTWIPDGKPDAKRIVYVFTDINCGFCNRLWVEARPWVESGKVQIRHIMVGIIRDNSSAKAATVLTDANPSARMDAYGNFIRAGRPASLSKDDIQPMDAIPAEVMAKIDANHQLMASLKLQATPSLVWKDEAGNVQIRTGAPEQTVLEAFGPKP